MGRLHDVTLETLDGLPEPCRSCVFWEDARGRQGAASDPRQGRAAKEAWWQATQLEWGTPSKALYIGGTMAGYAAFAPGAHYPRARRLGPTVSDDALLLAVLWVAPEHRGAGLARTLLQAVLREAHRHGSRAVEAYGWRHQPADATCLIPEDFLLANGFAVLHEHELSPLLRLDLRQTARESIHHALEGVLSALTRRERAPAPAPAPRSTARPLSS
jgi:GNAT superfamily N-acetyltransferase